jgi:hypothetical protein
VLKNRSLARDLISIFADNHETTPRKKMSVQSKPKPGTNRPARLDVRGRDDLVSPRPVGFPGANKMRQRIDRARNSRIASSLVVAVVSAPRKFKGVEHWILQIVARSFAR